MKRHAVACNKGAIAAIKTHATARQFLTHKARDFDHTGVTIGKQIDHFTSHGDGVMRALTDLGSRKRHRLMQFPEAAP